MEYHGFTGQFADVFLFLRLFFLEMIKNVNNF